MRYMYMAIVKMRLKIEVGLGLFPPLAATDDSWIAWTGQTWSIDPVNDART